MRPARRRASSGQDTQRCAPAPYWGAKLKSEGMVIMAENSGRTAKGGCGRPFQPGQSGNPGGRPKALAEVRDLARQHTAAAIRALLDVMQSSKNPSARVAAATALLDRGWGKATQSFLEESAGPQEIVVRYVDEPPVSPPRAVLSGHKKPT